MHKKIVLPAKCLVAALFCLTQAMEVIAQGNTSQREVDHTYAEARYIQDGSDRYGADGYDGPEIGGSYQVTPDWLAFGSYSSRTYSSYNYDYDLTELELGGGMILRGIVDWDLIAKAAVVKRDYGYDWTGYGRRWSSSDSDVGVRASVGVRDFFFSHIEQLEPLELRGTVFVEHIGSFETYVEAGADYHFAPGFAAGVQVAVGTDGEVLSGGVRWFF